MTWLFAIVAGGAVAIVYCAALRIAIHRTMSSTTASLSWFFMTSLARVAIVVGTIFGLVVLGADVALCALVGFTVARGVFVGWVGGVHGS